MVQSITISIKLKVLVIDLRCNSYEIHRATWLDSSKCCKATLKYQWMNIKLV